MKDTIFEIEKESRETKARAGILRTAHSKIETPVFMPVGTQGAVKTMTPKDLEYIGNKIILANTYHLYLRPGHRLIENLGGLQKFTGFNGAFLTDSGGYQVFSLAKLRQITKNGVIFRSHLDGSKHLFTPELVIDIQQALGSDIMMVLDECPPYPASRGYALESLELTLDWARRSKTYRTKEVQLLFGIQQGGMYRDLREKSAESLYSIGFDGYAIGGLSVGEPKDVMREVLSYSTELLPHQSPRYLMGVGTPHDILESVAVGVDMFDCVLPTRNARNGNVFTSTGVLKIRNARYLTDPKPLDDDCNCYVCSNFSRAYIRHLYNSGEISAKYLLTLHNLYFMQNFMKNMRQSIMADGFVNFKNKFLEKFDSNDNI